MTSRAVRVLKEVQLIAAEDTRHSRPLLTHFGVRTRMISYNQHNKRSKIRELLNVLESGNLALISDAGTPGIADPGFELIQAAVQAGNHVEVLPGASSVIVAAVLASLPSRGFVFVGFLPRTRADAKTRLEEVAHLAYTLVIFEAPHRVVATLDLLEETVGNRDVVAIRELTKIHEQVIRGSLREVRVEVVETEPRGEWVLVVGAATHPAPGLDEELVTKGLEVLSREGMTSRDAIRITSEIFGVPRSRVYEISVAKTTTA